MHWKSWKELCKPKSKGGMGFRNLVDFNQSLLAKQAWRLMRFPDTLVARAMRSKYYPDGDVSRAKIKSNCSYSWRSVVWGSELLRKGLMWKIGDGREVRVFGDSWLPNLPYGKTLRNLEGYENMRVDELLDVGGNWDINILQELMLPIESEEILKLDTLGHDSRDRRFWKFDPRGEYNVKSGYLVASGYFDMHDTCSSNEKTKWWKYVWSFALPQRIKIFAWRTFHNIIPTEFNLHKHHVPVFGRCEWCRKGWGTTAHTLLFCEKIRDLWSHLEFWEVLKKWKEFEIAEIGRAMKDSASRESFEIWIVGMWLVWKALCEEKHKGEVRAWSDLKLESQRYIETYQNAAAQAGVYQRVLPPEGSSSWIGPRRGRYRLDVDYAADETRRMGGVGAIARDSKGNIIFALAKPVAIANTSLHGELRAMMYGICQSIEDELSPVEVFSDSMLAVIAVEEEQEEDSVLYKDFFEFFMMVKKLNVLSFNHVRRDANKAAHELARLASSSDTTLMWHEDWPIWLKDIVGDDSS